MRKYGDHCRALLLGTTILWASGAAAQEAPAAEPAPEQPAPEAYQEPPVEVLPEHTIKPSKLSINGQIRQGVSLAIDPALGGETGLGPTQFTVQAKAEYQATSDLKFTADLWLRGDWFYKLRDGGYRQPGLKDFTAGPPFLKAFANDLTKAGTGALPQPFGDNGKDPTVLSHFNRDIIRQMSVTYSDPDGAFVLAFGKFQRGWGQSDGLRLLDVVYAQDLRQRAIFTDTEDLRLPAWSAAIDVNLEEAGFAAPFEALGLEHPSLEFLWVPEVRHAEVAVNNPTPSSRTNGGLFGLPFPSLVDGNTGWGLPFIGANLKDKDYKTFQSGNFGLRFKFGMLGGEATLNGLLGHQELPIVELTGSQLIIGNALNNPTAPGVVAAVPLDVPTTIGAVHAPGQYLSFLSAVKNGTVAPGQFPLLPFGCNDILVAAPNCSVNVNFDLNYRYRKKLLGMSFIRDMVELPLGPKGVTPVVRMELAYEFDKPFNVGRITTPFGNVATGTSALVAPVATAVTRRDQFSAMFGFDYFLWLPFWESQEASIFMTTQFFNIHTSKAKDLLFQAPYVFEFVEKNHNYFTQTWTLPLRNQTITLDGLLVWDIDKKGVAYRQRVEFATMGGRLRPRLEYGMFSGKQERGLIGYFKNSDYLELSIAYQF